MGYKSTKTLIKLSLSIIIGSAVLWVASAQQNELDFLSNKQPTQTSDAQSPSSDQETSSETAPPLSELDILSQTKQDDPFGAITPIRSREPISVTLRALDKIIARTIDIEVPINTLATFGTLEIIPRFCDKRPPEDFPETTAFLEIFDTLTAKRVVAAAAKNTPEGSSPQIDISTTRQAGEPAILADPIDGPKTDGDRIFTGWMFASSPGLNALEHTVYDIWVIDCKTKLVENEGE